MWLLNTSWRVCGHLCKKETIVAETYLIYKIVTGILHAERMLTYVTMGLPLIEKGSWPCLCRKIIIFCCLQSLHWGIALGDKQHFKGAWLPEDGGQNEHEFSECCNHLQPKFRSTKGRETVIHWHRQTPACTSSSSRAKAESITTNPQEEPRPFNNL